MASGDSLCVFMPGDAEPGPASAFRARRNDHPVLTFDKTPYSTYFTGLMPRNYAGGNLTVNLHWAASFDITGTGAWDVTFERIGTAQNVNSSGYATAQAVTAATVPATAGLITIGAVTCTAGAAGTDSVAAGELFRLRVRRATDTAVYNLELLAVEIQEA